MNNEKLLEAIKTGIKGELDSINLYSSALENTRDQEVHEFLHSRREEEKLHYNYLLKYYRKLDQGVDPAEIELEIKEIKEVSPMISEKFIKAIAGSQVLFSSLSTAALLEKNSIDFYRKCAAEAEQSQLKLFFNLMVKWETRHYDDIMEIQKEAEHEYWEINRFEPF